MPNFWEETSDAKTYWGLTNKWMARHLKYKCITVKFEPEYLYQISGVLCVALGNTDRSDEDHAVVWKDGVLHDPHPLKSGLIHTPDTFTLFIPLDPKKG